MKRIFLIPLFLMLITFGVSAGVFLDSVVIFH